MQFTLLFLLGTVLASSIEEEATLLPISISKEKTAELIAPIGTIGVDEADAVFNQLVNDVTAATNRFGAQTQALLGKVYVNDRNTPFGPLSATLMRDLYPSPYWSHFTYNCACKTAVPVFRVSPCDRPALLQVTDFLATGDAYRVYANDQLIMKTPLKRSLGLLTLSYDPSAAMLSSDWSHGEVPIEARTAFTLKIVPRQVTYESGRGAVRLLPLDSQNLPCYGSSRLFVVTTNLPWEQASDACAAFDATLATLRNERQVKEVSLALNKLPGCPTVWFGGVGDSRKATERLFLLYNPVSEQAVIDQVPRYDSSMREVLCERRGRK